MNRRPTSLCRMRWIAVVAIIAWLFVPTFLRAQSYGPEIDICNYNSVDSGNDVEQTVCLWGDVTGLGASADTDTWAQSDWINFPNGDLYVVGLGAEAQLGEVSDAGYTPLADSGMSYNGPYGWIVQENMEAIPDAQASTSITPQLGTTYVVNGSYSECIDPTGSGSDSCNWSSPAGGMSQYATLTNILTPTLVLSSSGTPSTYGAPVTFTVTLAKEPDQGAVLFYDGSTYLGSGYNYGSYYNSATFTTSSLAVGTHSITAYWAGDFATNSATSNALTQVISPTVWDTGSVTLTVGGTSETASYGLGSTASTIAQSLATAFTGNSQVSVNAFGDLLTITAKQSGSGGEYQFSVGTTDSGLFSSPSFYPSPASGSLFGDTTGAIPIYTYNVPLTGNYGGANTNTGGYDSNGNILAYTDSVMGSWQFGYDQLNRLVTASNTVLPPPNTITVPYPSWAQNFCWAYDAFGNRLQQNMSNVAFTWGDGSCSTSGSVQSTWSTYNAQNQITGTNAPNVTPYVPSYDAAGDVSADVNNTYLYDAEGRICAASTLSGAIGYLYDAAGNRVAKGTITQLSCDITQNGFTQTAGYVVDSTGEQLTEVDAAAVTTANPSGWAHTNFWANGKQIGTYDGNVNAPTLHFYFDDPLGTRRAQTNATGALEAVYESLPFGDDLVSSGPTEDPTENHFTGKERDTESGNDYFNARYYNSATGRFLSPDWSAKGDDPVPYANLDDPQSLNLYSYVYNRPLNKADLGGHAGCELEGMALGAGCGALNEGAEEAPKARVIGGQFAKKKKASHPSPYQSKNKMANVLFEETGTIQGDADSLHEMRVASGHVYMNVKNKSAFQDSSTLNARDQTALVNGYNVAAYNDALNAAKEALSDTSDPTGGKIHFFIRDVTEGRNQKVPSWANGNEMTFGPYTAGANNLLDHADTHKGDTIYVWINSGP
ncbi:MAG: RHS repeat-associated core domain-containing protein [Acidobacteriaceae bacterium]|jgi:RHS repeat-associated protein